MPKRDSAATKRIARTLKRSVETFERLSEALRKRVDALAELAGDAVPDTGRLKHDIVALQGAWRMTQDAIQKFREDQREKAGVGPDGVDFAAAREEILGRLARLVGRA